MNNSLALKLVDHTATIDLARRLSGLIVAGDVLCLHGTLGVGKSFFARALIQHLTASPVEVPSPTFTLVQTYETPAFEIWHFDLYRIHNPNELIELGFEEALGVACLVIEWPEKLGEFLPEDRLELHLSSGLETDQDVDDETRQVECRGFGSWQARMSELRDQINVQ